jgi:hypothetical protein
MIIFILDATSFFRGKPKCDKIIPEEDQRWESKRCGIYSGKFKIAVQERALESLILHEGPSACSRICLPVPGL